MHDDRLLLSTGSTLLNLACSDSPHGGFRTGTIVLIGGDSDSGKTWLGLSCFAEACIDKRFAEHRLIYDNPEDGAGMDFAHYFGQAVADRIEQPCDDGPSTTLDELYDNVTDALRGPPCIYLVDSLDPLDAETDLDDFEERKGKRRRAKAAGKDADLSGSYGMQRPKINSANLRKVKSALIKAPHSIVILLTQARDAVGKMGFGPKRTIAGGRALRFYSTIQMWSSVKETLTKPVRDEKVQIGVLCKINLDKNHQTGKRRTVEFPIFHSYGIADTLSCIDYLVRHKHWPLAAGVINAKDFDLKLKRMPLAKKIETDGLVKQLRSLVGDVWDEIEQACVVPLPRRYE